MYRIFSVWCLTLRAVDLLLSWCLCVERMASGQNRHDNFLNTCASMCVSMWEAHELQKGHNVSIVTQSSL